MNTLVHIHAIIAQEQMPVLIAVLPAVDLFLLHHPGTATHTRLSSSHVQQSVSLSIPSSA